MTERFIPYEKLSPGERRKIDAKRRRIWDGLSPVTRAVPNGKAYSRKIKHKNKEEI